MSTEKSQQPNPFETSKPPENLDKEESQSDVELVNPNSLISRQTPSEMSGTKMKKLKKKIKEQGFETEKAIEVADVDGRLIILDGHHRVAAAKQLGLKSIPIKRRKVSQEREDLLLLEAAEAQKYQQY